MRVRETLLMYKELLKLYERLKAINYKLNNAEPFIPTDEIEKLGEDVEILKEDVKVVQKALYTFYDTMDCLRGLMQIQRVKNEVYNALSNVKVALELFSQENDGYPEEMKEK